MVIEEKEKMIAQHVNFYYGQCQILKNITASFMEHTITAIIGPSGQGKSTFLGLFNGMWDDNPAARYTGEILIRLNETWISPFKKDIPLPQLRRKAAMIFQEPNPLPMSIGRNMTFPFKLAGVRNKQLIKEKVEQALIQSFLWDEVKDRMDQSAMELSGGQKQRLCIARALVMDPEILLCDEPTSSLDSKAASVIEDLLVSLKTNCTLLVVSHYMDQVARIADRVMAIEDKELIQMK